MQTLAKAPVTNLPWFKTWFNSAYYHKLYGHRNDKEAADFIDNLMLRMQPKKGSTMLDVGCGAGRHCRQLGLKGYRVTGIDLASSSIREAKKLETDSVHFFRHDMRVPFGSNQFDYVFNFFTSFGYFKNKSENNTVIRNMSNALKPGGTLVIDYMNIYYAESRLIPQEEKEIDGVIYQITRWMDDNYFYKRIVIADTQLDEPYEFVEQVAKFNVNDFNQMFAYHNLQIEQVFGDYKLNRFDSNKSPRLVIIVKKVADS